MTDTAPTLSPDEVQRFADIAARLTTNVSSVILGKPEVVKLVQGIVDGVNPLFATVAQVKRFRLLPKELDHADGELTATQKVKRAAIAERFAALVEDMYGSPL